jgi:DNA repair exonuclease SbcCD nuclease subunit
MAKIYFVGDVHLQEQSPISRKDSYPTSILNKLSEIGNLVKENNIDAVIFSGDIFSTSAITLKYFKRCVKAFRDIPCPCYSIVGNHDIPRNNLDLMEDSPLDLLFSVGVLNHLDTLTYDDVFIKGIDYTKDLVSSTNALVNMTKDLVKNYDYSILVAHRYFNTPMFGVDNITPEELENLNYNMVFLGHAHDEYEDLKVGNTLLFRIGSLSRGTKANSQLYRENIYVLEFDTQTKQYTRVKVPCLPTNEAFKDRVFIEKQEEIQKNLDEVLIKFEYNQDESIYDYMDKIEMEEEIRNLITSYLESRGIIRV